MTGGDENGIEWGGGRLWLRSLLFAVSAAPAPEEERGMLSISLRIRIFI